MCPVEIGGNPGIVMSQMCVNHICHPSGTLICNGLLAGHLLTTPTPSMMKIEVAPVSTMAWVVAIVVVYMYSWDGLPHNDCAAAANIMPANIFVAAEWGKRLNHKLVQCLYCWLGSKNKHLQKLNCYIYLLCICSPPLLHPSPSESTAGREHTLVHALSTCIISCSNVALHIGPCEAFNMCGIAPMARASQRCVAILNIKSTRIRYVPVIVFFSHIEMGGCSCTAHWNFENCLPVGKYDLMHHCHPENHHRKQPCGQQMVCTLSHTNWIHARIFAPRCSFLCNRGGNLLLWKVASLELWVVG